MQETLEKNNLDFLYEIKYVTRILEEKDLPQELKLVQNWLLRRLRDFELEIDRNLRLLSLENENIFDDILIRTQNFISSFRELYSHYISPIYRFLPDDIFTVKLISWLHNQHDVTKNKEFMVSDGNFSIMHITNNMKKTL